MTNPIYLPAEVRELLARLQERLDPHLDARDWGGICDLLSQPQPACTWRRDGDTGAYETACGSVWHYTDGGTPEENGQYFCHHCGKALEEAEVSNEKDC